MILARSDAAQALARGRYQLDLAKRYLRAGSAVGLAHLLIGRAQDALGGAEAASSLDAAVAGLRKAGVHAALSPKPSSPARRTGAAAPLPARRT